MRPEVPRFESEAEPEGPILPPFPIPDAPDAALAAGDRLRVRDVAVRGNTALPDETLRRITDDYRERDLAQADLIELRDRITLAYVDAGYATSGAVIPAQTVRDGVLEVQVVEGRIGGVSVRTDGRFREGHLRRRLAPDPDEVFRIDRLQQRLQRLQQDDRIERVDARILPTPRRGEAELEVVVRERAPYAARAELSNTTSPSIGAFGGELALGFENALGVGDSLSARSAFTEGLRQGELELSAPINRFDTRFGLRAQWSQADVVEEPVASALDIESRSFTAGVELRQPLVRTPRATLETFVRGEWRRSKSLLDDRGFSFSEGPERGVSKIAALRWGIDWTGRTRTQALSLRSLLSLGVDALGATTNGSDVPDGRFVAWLAQAQWAARLPWLDAKLLARGDLQIASDPLLALEQYSIGGRHSVRGYRENALVRDSGATGSIEFHLPLYQRVEPPLHLTLIPFFEAGYSWNRGRANVGEQTLLSAGVGGRAGLSRTLEVEVLWGGRLRPVDRVNEYDLQDDGIHLRLIAAFP